MIDTSNMLQKDSTFTYYEYVCGTSLSIHTRKKDYGNQTFLWSFCALRQNTSRRGLLSKYVSNVAQMCTLVEKVLCVIMGKQWVPNLQHLWASSQKKLSFFFFFAQFLLAWWLFCSVRRKTKYCNWMLPNFFIKTHYEGATIKL